MPDVKKHCAISKKRTGFAFGELHDWIDKCAKNTGVSHRRERHYFNPEDQKTIKDYWDERKGKGWGEKAIVEWLFHIALDNLDTAYQFSLKKGSYGQKTHNCIKVVFKPNGYIDCKFERSADV
jgi:hypothetical protein